MVKKDRTAQRYPCAHCSGKGVKAIPGEDCEKCRGRGYIENPPGFEIVCPSCNGDGYKMTSRACNECKGKGFTIRIYELTEEDHVCLACGTKGKIDVDHRQQVCPKCYGSGAVITYICKTIH